MDGNFFSDERAPFIIADAAAVTLSTTDKALIPVGNLPTLGSNYWWAGKIVKIKMFGRFTSGATPGNGTFDLYWGNGGDANGTLIQSSATFALTASMTNTVWWADLMIRCRGIGTSGSLLTTGTFGIINSATATTAASVFPIPDTAPAPVTIDATAANVISPQFKRSGSTVETMQVHEYSYQASN
jgi:hypothetical protein